MRETQTIAPGTAHDEQSRDERDQTLATLFLPGELVIQVDEQYNATFRTWTVDIVRMGKQGHWMRQRYKYDVTRRIVYFFGESAISEEEFLTVRRTGKILQGA